MNNEHQLTIFDLRSKQAINLNFLNSSFVNQYSTFRKFIETKVTTIKLQGFA